jgi:hypothetical protein
LKCEEIKLFDFLYIILDNYLKNKTSRQLQNYQHKVGGLYGVLLITTGAFITKDFWIGVGVGILSMIVQRLSSEISYRTQFKIQEEIQKSYRE